MNSSDSAFPTFVRRSREELQSSLWSRFQNSDIDSCGLELVSKVDEQVAEVFEYVSCLELLLPVTPKEEH